MCLHAVAGSTDVNESVVLSAGGDACVHDASGAEGVCAGVKFGASAQMSASLEDGSVYHTRVGFAPRREGAGSHLTLT